MPQSTFAVSDPSLRALARSLEDLLGEALDAATLVLERASSGAREEGVEVLAVLRRGDPRDALLVSDEHVARRAADLLDDPATLDPSDPLRSVGDGARIGAVGDLRVAQLRATRPDLVVERFDDEDALLAAFDADEMPAVLISSLTLNHIDRPEEMRRRLDPPWIGEPAAGAVWIRGPWNPDLRERLLPLEDRNSRIEVVTELALVEVFAPPDGCLFGAQARMSHSRLELRALVIDEATGRAIGAKRTGEATMRGAHRVAGMLARLLEERGAGRLGQGRQG